MMYTLEQNKNINGILYSYVLPNADNEKWFYKFNRKGDAFFPFWIEDWPSAFAMKYFLDAENLSKLQILEIGCGAGVLGQLLEVSYIQTDLLEDSVFFSSEHNQNNGVVMDMGAPCFSKVFDLVIATDIFYEEKLAELFIGSLSSLLRPNGKAIVCSPKRLGQNYNEALKKTTLQVKEETMYISLDHKLTPFDFHTFYAPS